MDLEELMAARVRRHMVMSFAGVFCAIALMFVAGAAARMIFGETPPVWVRLVPLVGILAIPAIGFYSTFTNLRCPSCNRLVIWEMAWNYSLFSAMAPKTCHGCGKKIFGDLLARRFRRIFIVMFSIGIGLGVLGAVANALMHHR